MYLILILYTLDIVSASTTCSVYDSNVKDALYTNYIPFHSIFVRFFLFSCFVFFSSSEINNIFLEQLIAIFSFSYKLEKLSLVYCFHRFKVLRGWVEARFLVAIANALFDLVFEFFFMKKVRKNIDNFGIVLRLFSKCVKFFCWNWKKKSN